MRRAEADGTVVEERTHGTLSRGGSRTADPRRLDVLANETGPNVDGADRE